MATSYPHVCLSHRLLHPLVGFRVRWTCCLIQTKQVKVLKHKGLVALRPVLIKTQVKFKPIERFCVIYVGFVIGIISWHLNRPLSPQNFSDESEFLFHSLLFNLEGTPKDNMHRRLTLCTQKCNFPPSSPMISLKIKCFEIFCLPGS